MAFLKGYEPGHLIYTGKPYILTLRENTDLCSTCFSKSSLVPCKGCKFVKYCSTKCQKEAEGDHKLECALLKNLKDVPQKLQPQIRLFGLLIMKIKGQDWDDIYESVNGEKVTFASLPLRSEEIRKDPRKVLYLKEVHAHLRGYIGDTRMQGMDVWKIIEKVRYNQLIFNSTVSRSAGRSHVDAIFLCALKLEHSCVPNAEFEILKGRIVVRAIKTISKGEKVFVSYIPAILQPSSALRSDVLETFVGCCQCEDCSKPYGTSVLTKVLDENKSSAVEQLSEEILNTADVFEKVGLPLTLKDGTNYVLRQQDGVLGNTNILRIKVLALKTIFLSNDCLEARSNLLQLLEYMEEAFGEYHREVRLLHFLLLKSNIDLCDFLEVLQLQEKIAKFEEMGFESLFM